MVLPQRVDGMMSTATLASAQTTAPEPKDNDTGRLEAFSDGVIAIAITLLVLDLHVPTLTGHVRAGELWRALRSQWPSYDAFIISFAVIGVMWANHHNIFRIIARTDHYLILLNLALLFCIAVIPFPTSLLSEFLGRSGEATATQVYTGWFAITAFVFNRLWWYASTKAQLLDPLIDRRAVAGVSRSYALGLIGYAVAFALSFVSPTASLVIIVLLGLVFVLPSSSGGVTLTRRPEPAPAPRDE